MVDQHNFGLPPDQPAMMPINGQEMQTPQGQMAQMPPQPQQSGFFVQQQAPARGPIDHADYNKRIQDNFAERQERQKQKQEEKKRAEARGGGRGAGAPRNQVPAQQRARAPQQQYAIVQQPLPQNQNRAYNVANQLNHQQNREREWQRRQPANHGMMPVANQMGHGWNGMSQQQMNHQQMMYHHHQMAHNGQNFQYAPYTPHAPPPLPTQQMIPAPQTQPDFQHQRGSAANHVVNHRPNQLHQEHMAQNWNEAPQQIRPQHPQPMSHPPHIAQAREAAAEIVVQADQAEGPIEPEGEAPEEINSIFLSYLPPEMRKARAEQKKIKASAIPSGNPPGASSSGQVIEQQPVVTSGPLLLSDVPRANRAAGFTHPPSVQHNVLDQEIMPPLSISAGKVVERFNGNKSLEEKMKMESILTDLMNNPEEFTSPPTNPGSSEATASSRPPSQHLPDHPPSATSRTGLLMRQGATHFGPQSVRKPSPLSIGKGSSMFSPAYGRAPAVREIPRPMPSESSFMSPSNPGPAPPASIPVDTSIASQYHQVPPNHQAPLQLELPPASVQQNDAFIEAIRKRREELCVERDRVQQQINDCDRILGVRRPSAGANTSRSITATCTPNTAASSVRSAQSDPELTHWIDVAIEISESRGNSGSRPSTSTGKRPSGSGVEAPEAKRARMHDEEGLSTRQAEMALMEVGQGQNGAMGPQEFVGKTIKQEKPEWDDNPEHVLIKDQFLEEKIHLKPKETGFSNWEQAEELWLDGFGPNYVEQRFEDENIVNFDYIPETANYLFSPNLHVYPQMVPVVPPNVMHFFFGVFPGEGKRAAWAALDNEARGVWKGARVQLKLLQAEQERARLIKILPNENKKRNL